MNLVYLWIEKEGILENIGLNFGGPYNFHYSRDTKTLKASKTSNYIPEDRFYSVNSNKKNTKNNKIKLLSCLVGKNGSGKTTSLKAITRYLNSIEEDLKTDYIAIWYSPEKNKFPKSNDIHMYCSCKSNSIELFKGDLNKGNYIINNSILKDDIGIVLYSNYLTDNNTDDYLVKRYLGSKKISFENKLLDLRLNTVINANTNIETSSSSYGIKNGLSSFRSSEIKQNLEFMFRAKELELDKKLNKYLDANVDGSFTGLLRNELKITFFKLDYGYYQQRYMNSSIFLSNSRVKTTSKAIMQLKNIDNYFENKLKILLNDYFASKSVDSILLYLKWFISYQLWFLILDFFCNTKPIVPTSTIDNVAILNEKVDNPLDILRELKNFLEQYLILVEKKSNTITYRKPYNFVLDNIECAINKLEELIKVINEIICQNFSKDNNFISSFEKNIEKGEFIFETNNNNNILKYLLQIIDFHSEIQNCIETKDFCNVSWNPPHSSGENALLTLLSRIYSYLRKEKQTKQLFLLIDEAELGFHPAWQKKYIELLVFYCNNLIPMIYPKSRKHTDIQIIITTNNPIPLSDVLPQNIIYIDFSTITTKPKLSFGTDLLTLYSNSFFINDGLIGSFANSKIKEIIDSCKNVTELTKDNIDYYNKIIDNIGDEHIKTYLRLLLQNHEAMK